jgi:hypothetical protein
LLRRIVLLILEDYFCSLIKLLDAVPSVLAQTMHAAQNTLLFYHTFVSRMAPLEISLSTLANVGTILLKQNIVLVSTSRSVTAHQHDVLFALPYHLSFTLEGGEPPYELADPQSAEG